MWAVARSARARYTRPTVIVAPPPIPWEYLITGPHQTKRTGRLSEILWRRSEADVALRNLGLSARGYRLVTTLPSLHASRCAFRVSLSDGRTVKLRRLSREEDADRLCRLRESLPPGFVPVLAHSEAFLLEPWIDGQRLRSSSLKRLTQADTMLRALHAVHPPIPAQPATYVNEVELGLEELREARKLSPTSTEQLRALALASRPNAVSETLLHQDFCAENIVVSRDDAMWVVDNETLRMGPIELELARIRHRWPMSEVTWRRFLTLYGGDEPSPFWHVLARLRGAGMRVRNQLPLAREAVDKLKDLLRVGRT